MQSTFLKRELDSLLGRLSPGTTHAASFRRAIEGCFAIADTAANQKRDLSFEPGLTNAHRKTELAQLVDTKLYPELAALTQPVRKAKARADAERAKYSGGYMPREISGLYGDVGCVEAATYFAQRELKPLSAMDEYDLHLLMTSDGGK